MKFQHLIDERVKLFEDNKTVLDRAEKEKRTPTADENAEISKREARAREIKETLTRQEELDAEERDLAKYGESRGRKTGTVVADPSDEPTAEEQQLAFRGWAAGKYATPEAREAAKRCGFDIGQPYIDMASKVVLNSKGEAVRAYLPVRVNSSGDVVESRGVIDARARARVEGRVLSVGTTTAGGNSVSNEMMVAFTEKMKWYAFVEGQATGIDTETGGTLPWPTVSDTANTGRVLAESTAATTTTDPTFGVTNLGAFKLSSDAVLVSYELLQDSFINLESWLGSALGKRLGRISNTKFTTGAGTTEPAGIITGATTSAAAATNAFTLDEVITLIHAVDKAYRGLPNTGFMFHDTIAAYLRKFKDGEGRYLWEPTVQNGQPDRFMGYPVFINNDMDSALTTAKKLVAFGNVEQAYVVRRAGATRFLRDDSIKVAEHQIYFEAIRRADGNTVDSTAFKVLTLA